MQNFYTTDVLLLGTLWRVATSVVKSSKIVKLPNTYNGIYEELRSASLNPERRK